MIDFDEQLREPLQRDRRRAAEVEHLALRLRPPGRQQKRLHRVVHVGEVAQLLPTPHLEGLPFDQAADPDADERLARILHAHAAGRSCW
jgi:hypothetical protein